MPSGQHNNHKGGYPKGKPRKKPSRIQVPKPEFEGLRSERPGLWKLMYGMDEKLKRIESQNQVIIIRLASLEKENSQLQVSVKGLCQTLLELFDQPESVHHAEAIVRDWLIKLHKK